MTNLTQASELEGVQLNSGGLPYSPRGANTNGANWLKYNTNDSQQLRMISDQLSAIIDVECR